MIFAGAGITDITPRTQVWMDGMLRARPSEGVHDSLSARALVLSDSHEVARSFVLVTVDVCALDGETTRAVRTGAALRTGLPASRIVVAATHTHAGPSTVGIFTPREPLYIEELTGRLIDLIALTASDTKPVELSFASGTEETISHYRRLLADDGHVVMNWVPYPPEHIVGPLGTADPQVSVVKVEGQSGVVALVFNHAGHPNVLSGDNYLLSADYPGVAARLLEAEFGGTALFFNGAQGSVDIDGLRHRDWEGMDRAGYALAQAASSVARASEPCRSPTFRSASVSYVLPGRRITDEEWRWAQAILEITGGKYDPIADGVGEDYKAVFYRRLHDAGPCDLPVEQTCLALGDCALLTFPGELYTEIGLIIKAQSPFRNTCIIGLANGYIGYVPTRRAISEGGYVEDTRRVGDAAEEVVLRHSLALLERVYASSAPASSVSG